MRSTAAKEVDAVRRWVLYVLRGNPRESTLGDMACPFLVTTTPGASGCPAAPLFRARPTARVTPNG
jgi:hypothetical protein